MVTVRALAGWQLGVSGALCAENAAGINHLMETRVGFGGGRGSHSDGMLLARGDDDRATIINA